MTMEAAADARPPAIPVNGLLTSPILPTLLKGRGGIMGALGPLIAMAAYAIYKENAALNDDDSPQD